MPATIELLQEGRYRINEEYPLEGTGVVYEAYDTVRDSNVIVKEIQLRLNKVTTHSQQEILKLAFISQAKTLTEINHDSLLKVHDYFFEVGRQYLVVESVAGDELSVLLERNKGAFPISDVLGWADQLLGALNYLHGYQPPIFHRNVRPSNIKLDSTGKIKLLGFGSESSDTDVNTSLQQSEGDASELSYAPLEQIWAGLDSASQKVITNSYDDKSERLLKEPLDARSDLYSVGATIYHLITARKPVDALERSIDILEGKPDPLRPPVQVDPNIAPEISDLLMKAMEIKRENRFDSTVIMRQVLRTALVRAKERADEESREQDEASEDLRFAQQTRHEQVRTLVEQKRIEIEAEQKRQTELIKQQLREAEEQRLLAEQRAAEAERRLQEREAAALAASEAASAAAVEEKLLELSPAMESSAQPNPVEDPINDVVVVERVYDVPSEETLIEAGSEEPESISKTEEPEIAAAEEEPKAEKSPSVAGNHPIAVKSQTREIPTSTEDDFVLSHAPKASSFGLKAIGVGAAGLLVTVIGIWAFMPSSQNVAVQPAAIQTAAETQPAAPEPNLQQAALPTTEQNNSQDPSAQPISTFNEPASTEPEIGMKPASQSVQAKSKKTGPAPSKEPSPQKKSVTVDDLINDN